MNNIHIQIICFYRSPDQPFPDLEKEFEPNLLNSTVYMISMTLQLSTFAINYRVRLLNSKLGFSSYNSFTYYLISISSNFVWCYILLKFSEIYAEASLKAFIYQAWALKGPNLVSILNFA